MTLCMVARLRGGANPPSQRGTGTASGGAGQWFCVACQLGGCYATRTRCFRCGPSRQESVQAMSGSAPCSWPLPPGLVHIRRQPRHVPPRETHYPVRPPTGPNFGTTLTFRIPGNKGNKQPNPGYLPLGYTTHYVLSGSTRSGLCSPNVRVEPGSRWMGVNPDICPPGQHGRGIVTVVSAHPARRCTSPRGVVSVGLGDGVGDCHDVANLPGTGLFISPLFFLVGFSLLFF